jgi:hypothetical protein
MRIYFKHIQYCPQAVTFSGGFSNTQNPIQQHVCFWRTDIHLYHS